MSALTALAKVAALRTAVVAGGKVQKPPAATTGSPRATGIPIINVKQALLRATTSQGVKAKLLEGVQVQERGFSDSFMGRLAGFEGTKAHTSLEGGKTTGAFGIKDAKGLVRLPREDDKEFARRVVGVHKKEVEGKIGRKEWLALPEGVKQAVLDLKFNVGSLGSKLIGAAKKGGDPKSVMLETLDTVSSTMLSAKGDFKKGDKVVSPGLAKRRAAGWNLAFPDRKIEEVEFEQKGSRTKVTYLADDGEVFSYTTKGSVSTDFRTKTGDMTLTL